MHIRYPLRHILSGVKSFKSNKDCLETRAVCIRPVDSSNVCVHRTKEKTMEGLTYETQQSVKVCEHAEMAI